MTSVEQTKKFHTDDVKLPRSRLRFWLGVASCPHGTTNQSNIKIREVTRHQYGIFAPDPQIPFPRETSGGVAILRLCCWAIFCAFHEYVEGGIIPAKHFEVYKKKKIGIPKIIENINRFANFEDTLCNLNNWVWWQNPPYFSHCHALRWVPGKRTIHYRHYHLHNLAIRWVKQWSK